MVSRPFLNGDKHFLIRFHRMMLLENPLKYVQVYYQYLFDQVCKCQDALCLYLTSPFNCVNFHGYEHLNPYCSTVCSCRICEHSNPRRTCRIRGEHGQRCMVKCGGREKETLTCCSRGPLAESEQSVAGSS